MHNKGDCKRRTRTKFGGDGQRRGEIQKEVNVRDDVRKEERTYEGQRGQGWA